MTSLSHSKVIDPALSESLDTLKKTGDDKNGGRFLFA